MPLSLRLVTPNPIDQQLEDHRLWSSQLQPSFIRSQATDLHPTKPQQVSQNITPFASLLLIRLISERNITDTGVASLSQALSSLKQLTSLKLNFSKYHNAAVPSLSYS